VSGIYFWKTNDAAECRAKQFLDGIYSCNRRDSAWSRAVSMDRIDSWKRRDAAEQSCSWKRQDDAEQSR
jgi:hypothetical protein